MFHSQGKETRTENIDETLPRSPIHRSIEPNHIDTSGDNRRNHSNHNKHPRRRKRHLSSPARKNKKNRLESRDNTSIRHSLHSDNTWNSMNNASSHRDTFVPGEKKKVFLPDDEDIENLARHTNSQQHNNESKHSDIDNDREREREE